MSEIKELDDLRIKPFVKWVGGKGQLLKQILPLIPEHDTYFEPFVGGGAVLFALNPKKSVISDTNSELINCYNCIKEDTDGLLEILKDFRNFERYDQKGIETYSKEAFYFYIRHLDREDSFKDLSNLEKAARFIFLNRNCFNGLYRVNKNGEFNTPFGKYENDVDIVRESVIRSCAELLQNTTIYNLDYSNILSLPKKRDFVFLDPPYFPVSKTSSFTSYTANSFIYEDLVNLKKYCDFLTTEGIRFMLFNSNTMTVKKLFKEYDIWFVNARRSINCKSEKRGAIKELAVFNYKIEENVDKRR